MRDHGNVTARTGLLRSRQGGYTVFLEDERASPEDVQKLKERLNENLRAYAAQIGPDTDFEKLHQFGYRIAMHEYLTTGYGFNRGEVELLLKYQDPLEVAVSCSFLENTIFDLDLGYCLYKAPPGDDFPMVEDTADSKQNQKTGNQHGGRRNTHRKIER